MIENIHWIQHGSFIITHPMVIYINPWQITQAYLKADVILISHEHYEHFSIADVDKVRKEGTRIITNERVATEIPDAEVLRPWQSININKANIKAVPAYSPDSLHHPLSHDGLGFIISLNYYDIYYAGDTKIIPEMQAIRPDIAILPIDGQGTLDIYEASQAIDILKPKWVMPSNWGKRGSTATPLDVMRFKDVASEKAQIVVSVYNPTATSK